WVLWIIADLLYCYATLPAPDDVVPQQQTLQVGQHVIWQQDIMICPLPRTVDTAGLLHPNN
ncbi:MAG: hypothetical protein ACXVZR_13655, partial [Terriglobales bacterium]